jgi:hypothetical protein
MQLVKAMVIVFFHFADKMIHLILIAGEIIFNSK